jgi:molecular chaperone DnaJ
MSLDIDYYELLEGDRTADDKVLKTPTAGLAMQFHPDRNPGCAEAEAKFKAISRKPMIVLKDPQKRAAYDRFGKAAFENGGMGGGGGQAGGFGDFSDISSKAFSAMPLAAVASAGRCAARTCAMISKSRLDEAFHGKAAEFTIDVSANVAIVTGSGATPGTSSRRCNLCGGHGKVRAQQGFFVVERTCPTCHGRGEVIESPCRKVCRGEGRVDERQD